MTMILYVLLGLAALALFVYILNKKAFSNIHASASAEVGKAGRWFWRKNALDIKKNMLDAKVEEIKNAEQSLISCAAEVKMLEGKQNSLKEQVKKLDMLAKQCVVENNDEKAKKFLLEKKGILDQLTKVEVSLGNFQNKKKEFSDKIDQARSKIKEQKDNILSKEQELSLAQNEAKLSQINSSFEGLNDWDAKDVDEEIDRQINKAKATSEIATQSTSNSREEYELEQRAKLSEVDQELENLKKSM